MIKLGRRPKSYIKGHWRFDVYDGDVERAELTSEEKAENEIWRKLGIHPEWGDVSVLWPVEIRNEIPLHIGQIVSIPIEVIEGDNLVTTAGKGLLLDRLFAMSGPPGQLTHMGVGNSATAAAVGDTQLLGSSPAPDLRAYDALPTRSGLVVTAIRTYATTEGNMNWQEIGLFNGGTNGTSVLFNRIAPIGAFNKTSAVAITATVTITQT